MFNTIKVKFKRNELKKSNSYPTFKNMKKKKYIPYRQDRTEKFFVLHMGYLSEYYPLDKVNSHTIFKNIKGAKLYQKLA